MKVLFYDGMMSERYFSLRYALKEEHYGVNSDSYIVDAVYGPGKCKTFLDAIKNNNTNAVVLTNSLIALDNTYCWNDKTHSCNLYIFIPRRNRFVSVNTLTDKDIKKVHNLEAMYRNGAFYLEDEDD